MGPTACGKSDIALEIAAKMNVRLISVDSAMVYEGLDIGTAKPDAEIRRRYTHELVDIRQPTESYSVMDFVRDADEAVVRAWNEDMLPLLVGGTMLYFKGFRDGLSPLPPSDADVRSAIEERGEREGWDKLYSELRNVDPDVAEKIHPNNHVRMVRALEVLELTGRTMSSTWKDSGTNVMKRLNCQIREFGVTELGRAELHQRIEERLSLMLQEGLVDEVAQLRDRFGIDKKSQSMRAVGYQQTCDYLEGELSDLNELEQKILAATRRVARAQSTWLRGWNTEHFRHIGPSTVTEAIVEDMRHVV